MRANITIHDGKQLAAARALAGLGIRDLAAAADIAPSHAPSVRDKRGYPCLGEEATRPRAAAVWARLMAALTQAGVELLLEGGSYDARALDGTA